MNARLSGAIIAAMFLCARGASAQQSDSVPIPKGTVIPVRLLSGFDVMKPPSSMKARLQVAQDVIVSGHLIAKAGDAADGVFTFGSSTAGTQGLNATSGYVIGLQVDDVANFCGDTIKTSFTHTEKESVKVAPFGKTSVSGGLQKDQIFAAATDRPQKVCSQKTSATPGPLPSPIFLDDAAAAPAK